VTARYGGGRARYRVPSLDPPKYSLPHGWSQNSTSVPLRIRRAYGTQWRALRLTSEYTQVMPNFGRYFRPGGTYFFTVVTYQRQAILCTPAARTFLRTALQECRDRWPLQIEAIVLLPDHLHTIWTLPMDDARYSLRWAWTKRRFTQQWLMYEGNEMRVTVNQRLQRRRGVFQPRFWEHSIRDKNDLEQHLNYIHYNPVKHGYVIAPRDWQYSSFHRFVKNGLYPGDWCCGGSGPIYPGIETTAVEPT
jgi:putative transposase